MNKNSPWRVRLSIFCFNWFCFCCGFGYSEDIFASEKNTSSYVLDNAAQGFLDRGFSPNLRVFATDDALDLTSVRARLKSTPILTLPSPNFGFSGSTYWLGLDVKNSRAGLQDIFFEVGYALLDNVSLYIVDSVSGEIIDEYHTGDALNFVERPILHPNFVFPVRFEARQHIEFIAKIRTSSSSQFPVRLWSTKGFSAYSQTSSAFAGALVGIIIVMAIYNLFLFFSLRDSSYLFFSITLICYSFVEGILTGFSYMYFWPNSPSWNDISLTVTSNIALASLCFFARKFLVLPLYSPWANRLLLSWGVIGLILVGLSFVVPYRIMIVVTAINVICAPLFSYSVGIYLVARGYKPAYFFSLAFTVFVVAAAIFVFEKMSIVDRTFATENSIHLGAILTVLLLSFALADRINREKNAREDAQQSAIDNLEKYRLIYENSLEGMFRVTFDGELLACNPAFAELMGARSEVDILRQGNNLSGLVPSTKTACDEITSTLHKVGHVFGFETRCRRLSGEKFWAAIFANKVDDPEQGVFIEGSIVDITDKKESEQKLSYMASHDILTGLYNRREFERRLVSAIELTQREGLEHALLYMDLDQFKIVNDTSGHSAGDELLKQLADLFKTHTRAGDSLARLGGDEFAMLLIDCDLTSAGEIANRLRSEVDEYRFVFGEGVFSVGISIGVVAVTDDAMSIEQLMSLADTACYAAKDAGRNRVMIHDNHSSVVVEHQNEMQVASSLKEAINTDRLILFKQSIVSLKPELEGKRYEILVRMQRDGKLVEPGAFLPAAERFSVIRLLDRWVVETYFIWLAKHPEHLASLCQVSINLSVQTILEDDFGEFLTSLFERHAIPVEKIIFEIAESAAITNIAKTSAFLKTMRDQNVYFSLDDFGSGLSAYSYLKTLPVKEIKIEGSFVRDILQDPVDRVLVKSIIDVAHTMGLVVVAESVESQDVLDELKHLDIDFAQGYFLHTPEHLSEDL